MTSIAVVAAVNDDEILHRNLLSSSGLAHVIPQRGYPSASRAYNAAIESVSDDVIAFVHQDIYLPAGWFERLSASIDWLEQHDEPWGVLGVWGIRRDGRFAGRVWCSGGGCEHSAQVELPAEVVSIDEVVIVLNKASGLRFDEDLPGFHLYATDICLQAAERGYKTFVIEAPVVHNSKPRAFLDPTYYEIYRYMQRKWRSRLPVRTCVIPITRMGAPVWRRKWRGWKGRHFYPQVEECRYSDPHEIAKRLGYER